MTLSTGTGTGTLLGTVPQSGTSTYRYRYKYKYLMYEYSCTRTLRRTAEGLPVLYVPSTGTRRALLLRTSTQYVPCTGTVYCHNIPLPVLLFPHTKPENQFTAVGASGTIKRRYLYGRRRVRTVSLRA